MHRKRRQIARCTSPFRVLGVQKRLTIFDWIYVTLIYGQMIGCAWIWALIGAEWQLLVSGDAPVGSNRPCDGPHARIAAISGPMPRILMTRLRL
jgi:hypothetical protein